MKDRISPARRQSVERARFGIYFGVSDKPRDSRDALAHSRQRLQHYIAAAIEHGVYSVLRRGLLASKW